MEEIKWKWKVKVPVQQGALNIIIFLIFLKTNDLLSSRNPIDFRKEAIEVPIRQNRDGSLLTSALMGSGFRIIHSNRSHNSLLPCSLGTFSNRLTRGTDGCTNCTPGELYNVFWSLKLWPCVRLNGAPTTYFVAADVLIHKVSFKRMN